MGRYGVLTTATAMRMSTWIALSSTRVWHASPRLRQHQLGMRWITVSTGETALIEFTDGVALGAYQIGHRDYTDVIFERWQQLLGQKQNSPRA